MAAKALHFDVGDYVVYPKHGVGRVIELQKSEIAGIALELRMQPGYDHSYLFVSTFMAEHIAWHAERLAKG